MLTNKELWQRISRWITVIGVAMVITIILNFLSLYLNNDEKNSSPGTKIVKVQPLPGHWLKTKTEDGLTRNHSGQDASPAPKNKGKPESIEPLSEAEKTEVNNRAPSLVSEGDLEAVKGNNGKLDNTDVMFYWTDGPELKAVTIMSINNQTKKGGVVAFPLFTRVYRNSMVTTIGEVFKAEGKAGTNSLLEEKLEITIDKYVEIDQRAFEKISTIMGPLELEGETVAVADAFEQTRNGQRKNDQAVVRAVANSLLTPAMLVKIPKILWVLSQEVETDLGPSEIMDIYRMTRNTDVNQIRKVALPGKNYLENGKFRDVPEEVWKNILWEITK